MDQLSSTLETYFGYTSFRPLQRTIIDEVVSGNDVFVVMPTGGGKSLCYQIPALVKDGLAIVISPLISLMKDQVDGLRQNGVKAHYLNSSLSLPEQRDVLKQVHNNNLSLLYIAPERFAQASFKQLLQKIQISLFAIDEAHCISEWGHDFRPDYRMLHDLKTHFADVPIIALTATATKRVAHDIVQQLGLQKAKHFQASFDRPNLTYYVTPKDNLNKQIIEYIKGHKQESGIIYCQTREKVHDIVKLLKKNGIHSLPYHAGLADEERRSHQEQFIRDDVQIVVATVAFGMGIDKPNVRYVIHADLPSNLERYYQETGRAGRDGLPSQCVLFYSHGDVRTINYFIDLKDDLSEQQIAYTQLRQMLQYAESKVCRHHQLVGYFGEQYNQPNCGACDNCLTSQETFDGTIISQKILSCVYRTGQRFGLDYVVKILIGSGIQKVQKHNTLSVFGIVKEYSEKDLKTITRELIQLDYLRLSEGKYPILSLGKKAIPVLKNTNKVLLHVLPDHKNLNHNKSQKDEPLNTILFNELKILRKQIADEQKVPPYVVFADSTLKEMASVLPQTMQEFSTLKGVGEQKLQKYGQIFLAKIQSLGL